MAAVEFEQPELLPLPDISAILPVDADICVEEEEDALQRVKQEEKDKRKAGKRAWHMKECETDFLSLTTARSLIDPPYTIAEKRELLVKARYDALAAEGGKRGVRKAIEKKQKKIGQKEKKRRPFDSKPPPSRKRSFEGSGGKGESGRRKRIRTE